MKWFHGICIVAVTALFIGCSGSTPEIAPVEDGKPPSEAEVKDYRAESMKRMQQGGGNASRQMQRAMDNTKNADGGN